MKFSNFIIYVFILIIGISIGFLFFKFINTNNNNKALAIIDEKCPYEYLNPLRCDPESKIQVKEYVALRNEILDYIEIQKEQRKTTKVSVFFRDLVTGSTMSIDAQESFAPASLLKVPLMMTYYKKAETDPSILTRRFSIAGEIDTLNQNIKPEKSVEIGKNYSIEELLELLITQSDNVAWQALLNDLRQNYSEEDFVITLSDLGIIDPRKDHDEQYITTQSYASIFRILYNASYLNFDMSNKALKLLSNSIYKNGLVAGLPDNLIVSHKFGEQKNGDIIQLHDCGIIYYEKNPYSLCVMTQGDDVDELGSVISEISKKVYKEVSSRN